MKTNEIPVGLAQKGVKLIQGHFGDNKIARQWLTATGPYGDFFRVRIVNPMLAGLLQRLQGSDPEEMRLSTEPVLLDSLAASGTSGSSDDSGTSGKVIDAWHAETPKRCESKIRIIDLGCGEGYRGRWLAPKGYEYYGVDYSQDLIAEGLKRAGKLKHLAAASLKHMDLSSTSVFDDLAPLCAAPLQMFLAVTLLDHLEEDAAIRLLRSLSRLGCDAMRSYLFVATCNPHYYRDLARLDDGQRAWAAIESLCTTDNKKKIRVEVRICKRSRSYYRKLFHDAGLCVLEQVTPVPTVSPTQDNAGFDHGTGPFHFWLIQLHGRKWEEMPLADAIRRLPDEKVGKRILEDVASRIHQLNVVRTRKDEPVVAVGDLGGELRVVIEGQCYLATSDQDRAQLPFSAGDLFGDLELREGTKREEPLRYRRSVMAHEDCLVAVIPEEQTQQVLSARSIEADLLRLLRSRLQSQIWLMDAKSGDFGLHSKDRPEETFPVLSKLEVQDTVAQATHYLAACLMGALEYQRNTFPGYGATLLLPQIADYVLSVGHVNLKYIPTAIELLVSAGVVYAANLTKTGLSYHEFEQLVHDHGNEEKGSNELWQCYWKHLRPHREKDRSKPTFYFVEDEWSLRHLASRPDRTSTKLLDNLLRLKSLPNGKLPSWEGFHNWHGVLNYGTTFQRRLHRFLNEVERYVRLAMEGNRDRDSRGFPLVPINKRRERKS